MAVVADPVAAATDSALALNCVFADVSREDRVQVESPLGHSSPDDLCASRQVVSFMPVRGPSLRTPTVRSCRANLGLVGWVGVVQRREQAVEAVDKIFDLLSGESAPRLPSRRCPSEGNQCRRAFDLHLADPAHSGVAVHGLGLVALGIALSTRPVPVASPATPAAREHRSESPATARTVRL